LQVGTRTSSTEIKEELMKLGDSLKSNIISALRQQSRRGRRLRRGKVPLGYFLKKLYGERSLDRNALISAFKLLKDTSLEHQLSSEIDYLVQELNQNPNEKTLAWLKRRIETLVNDYRRDPEDFLNIEVDMDIEIARKLHMIDQYIEFLKKVGGFKSLIRQLEGLKERAKIWVYQDIIDAKRLVSYARRSLGYAEHALEISEAIQENRLETYLNQQPFLITFHSANEKEFARSTMALGETLPDKYMGRNIEYSIEVDYFWMERDVIDAETGSKVIDRRTGKPKKRLSTFFGHVTSFEFPRKAEKFMKMYRGKTNPTIWRGREGLMLPETLLKRMRGSKVKLVIEIKVGKGKTETALDHLVGLVKQFGLQGSIIVAGFSAWPLAYLKQRLPHAFVIHMIFHSAVNLFTLGRNSPYNASFKNLKYMGPIFPNRYSFVNAFSSMSKKSEKAEIKQIMDTAKGKKFFVSWKVDTKKQLGTLIAHGGRGATIWKWPEEIEQWLLTSPETE